MSHCHYCRDAATTTAGGRDVCDDCKAAYDQRIAKQIEDAKAMKSKAIRGGTIRAGRGWVEYEARGRTYTASTPPRLWRLLCRVGVDRVTADEIVCAVQFLVDEVEVAK
jgi:hypothetical protein